MEESEFGFNGEKKREGNTCVQISAGVSPTWPTDS